MAFFRALSPALVGADSNYFDFDGHRRGSQSSYLQGAAGWFVGLVFCAEIFCVAGHEA